MAVARSARARHLVLGGSAGLGLAYAERLARHGDAIWIVARSSADLETARDRLLGLGAEDVEIRSANLTDHSAREAALNAAAQAAPFSTIFLSGPSPRPGHRHEVTLADHAHARSVCLDYPGAVLKGARRLAEFGGRLIVVSSSAADEPLDEHPFYLSALYRRSLDFEIAKARSVLEPSGIDVALLKPKVVLTRLSERFAQRLDPNRKVDEVLEAFFGQRSVPSASDYIERVTTEVPCSSLGTAHG